MADNELGEFLRARRGAVRPADVGLPEGGRRRTPGLRRAELATLAGISVDYLVRLEQGRDRRPSTQVLTALADALRMSADERVHLRNLVKVAEGDFMCPGVRQPATSVRASVLSLIERLEPAPAVLLNRLSDVVAYTSGYERLARPLGLLDSEPANQARFVFTDDRARTVFPDWDRVATEHAADLTLQAGRVDPYVDALVEELTGSAGAAFADRMHQPLAVPERPRPVRMIHPQVGELHLTGETLELAGDDDVRLVVYVPADDATSAALDELTGRRPGALRAVSS